MLTTISCVQFRDLLGSMIFRLYVPMHLTELVGSLLKHPKLAKKRVPQNPEKEKFIDQIITVVVKTKDMLNSREKLDRELVGYFEKIERQIDPSIDCKHCEKASELPQKATITEVGKEVSKVQEFRDLFWSLDFSAKMCLEIISIFPENTKLKKRLVINWCCLFYGSREDCERIISNLVDKKVLIAVHREHNKVIDCFTIEPIFHKWLISKSERYGQVSYDKSWEDGTWRFSESYMGPYYKILLNLDKRYLHSRDIMDMSSMYNSSVVELGSWCYTETEVHNGFEEIGSEETNSNDHIEVDQTDFLKKFGTYVRYLSLQGISGITELPESIGKLENMVILDLKACHNLEKLPQKPKSTLIQKLIRSELRQDNVYWFNKLKVLDISECYLLDHMPKWICELSNLEVLKGFLVGSLGNKNRFCRLGDLSKIKFLCKLSIRISNDILDPKVFQGFNSLDSLLVLTIMWGENKYKEIPTYSLPKNLEKLDIRCYPEVDASKLQNPEDLKKLKRLYIRGGNLTKIPHNDNWKVEVLRLRFLKKLVPTNWNEIRRSFMNLRYVEYVECPKPKNFPNDSYSWRNEE